MSKVHAAKFHTVEQFAGFTTEVYAPLCGVDRTDTLLTHDDDRVTCGRCLRILIPPPTQEEMDAAGLSHFGGVLRVVEDPP